MSNETKKTKIKIIPHPAEIEADPKVVETIKRRLKELRILKIVQSEK